jgi:hypothetical protein
VFRVDLGREELISNGGRFKSAFTDRDKKRTMTDLRGIPSNWFMNQFCPSRRFSRALIGTGGVAENLRISRIPHFAAVLRY